MTACFKLLRQTILFRMMKRDRFDESQAAAWIARIASSAAAIVSSIATSLCAVLTKPA
jgi:hypothetical protein